MADVQDMLNVKVGELEFLCGKTDADSIPFDGGCGKPVKFLDAYRCVDCTVYFHRDCASKHFGLPTASEQRQALRMDEWEKEVRSFVQEKDEHGVLGLVYTVVKECQERTQTETIRELMRFASISENRDTLTACTEYAKKYKIKL